MSYPLHGLGLYIREGHETDPRLSNLRRAGRGLRGLYKVLLLKRIESSLHAFACSTGRLLARLNAAIEALQRGEVLARGDELFEDQEDDAAGAGEHEALPARLFDQRRLLADLQADRRAVRDMIDDVELLQTEPDPKIARLRRFLAERAPRSHRTIVFTQFAETAEALRRALGDEFGRTVMVMGSTGGRSAIVRRFSPRSNRQALAPQEEIDLLISTDALSEGVNLQDADTLINYDLHWNPVRLIQRAGRIDRIGSENDQIVVASFLPERGLEQNLGIEAVLRRRIDEFLKVFGEDSRVLP
ncbi:MAG: SWF/SNF helicase family protein, partial [Sandaracinaceae bacterium]|nr:SWF/SNF helicase family protein [Sandaracinaceae bacterium]